MPGSTTLTRESSPSGSIHEADHSPNRYFRTGLYPAPKPEILGKEGEGVIVSTGDNNAVADKLNLKTGDRVVWMHTGAYAEYTAVPAHLVHVLPSGFPEGKAAAGLLQGLTALTLIREAHPVKAGEFVLVHAAAGGVGLLLCQMLKQVGARTIGTASTDAKCDEAKRAGAEFVINYSNESDLKGKILEITGGQGCQAIFDGVGKSTFDLDLEVVARKGTVVSFGNASGAVPAVELRRLTAKNAKLLRPTLFNYVATREEYETYSNELFKWIQEGKVDVKVHEEYPLEDIKRVHEDLEGRKTTGKLLLKL